MSGFDDTRDDRVGRAHAKADYRAIPVGVRAVPDEQILASAAEAVRTFATGATRSPDRGRDDPEGYLSPLAIDRYNEYMTKHRLQPDGTLRASDNWQKGIPLDAYMKGMWRHFLHLWTRHRGWPVRDPGATANIEEDLCSIIFNAQGYLHEVLKTRKVKIEPGTSAASKAG